MSLRPARSTLFPYTTLFRSWNAYILLNKGDIFTGSSGQIFKVSNIASCFTFPALQLLVDRFDTIQLLGQRRVDGDLLTVEFIFGTDFDRIEVIQDVQFREGDLIETIQAYGIAEGNQIEPAASAWPAGGRTKLKPILAERLSIVVMELCREAAITDTCTVGLGDAHDMGNRCRRDAASGAGTASRRGG